MNHLELEQSEQTHGRATRHVSNESLPFGWQRPVQLSQLELFQRDRDEVLAFLRVSRDDLDRWRAKGWLSADATESTVVQDPQLSEIVFVRNVARSGLSDSQVDALLRDLDAPYRYDPLRTAYSFAYGWVQIPAMPDEREMDTFFDEHFSTWIHRKISEGDTSFLEQRRFEIALAIADARTSSE